MNRMWVWSKITMKTETEKKVLFVLLGLMMIRGTKAGNKVGSGEGRGDRERK